MHSVPSKSGAVYGVKVYDDADEGQRQWLWKERKKDLFIKSTF